MTFQPHISVDAGTPSDPLPVKAITDVQPESAHITVTERTTIRNVLNREDFKPGTRYVTGRGGKAKAFVLQGPDETGRYSVAITEHYSTDSGESRTRTYRSSFLPGY